MGAAALFGGKDLLSGSTGGQQVYTPQTPQPPTVGQSAAEYAAALPSIYEASLKYQPEFNKLDYQSYADLMPKYTALADQISKQYYPETYGLQEQLAKQAREGSTSDVPQEIRQQYLSNMNAQLGNNVNAPIGADYVSRGLIDQAQQYRQYYQNLGLSLAGRQPLTTASYQQPSFNVAGGVGQNYATQAGAYGSYAGASRPFAIQAGTPNWVYGLQAAGNAAGMIGMAGCWVAAACFGGWHNPKTIFARYFVSKHAPKWFYRLYLRFGEKISKNVVLVKALKPLFEIFAYKGKRLLYGI